MTLGRRTTVCLLVTLLSGILVLGIVPPGTRGQGGEDWTSMGPADAPSPRTGAAMAYDEQADVVILFGGSTDPLDDSVKSNETWAYDFNGNTWEKRSPLAPPPGVSSASLAYDAESDRVILFGGSSRGFPWEGNPSVTSGTWAYDYANDSWSPMAPATHPSARCCAPMAYDAALDRIILVGGYAGDSLWDTWSYDYNTNTWTPVTPNTPPYTGDSAAIAYDGESDRVILFGGAYGGFTLPPPHDDNNRTWAFDGVTWVERQPDPSPSERWISQAAYARGADRVVLFGGAQGLIGVTPLNDTWTYDYNSNRWTDMNSPEPPAARCCHALAYDAESERVILFGGGRPNPSTGGQVALGDTWAYHYQANAPSAPRGLEAQAGNARVSLTWDPPRTDAGSALVGYRLYRGSAGAEMELVANLGTGTSHTDTGLTNGVTYSYSVSAVNDAGESVPSGTISATPGDTMDPAIAITSPVEDEVLPSAEVTVTGTASDDGVLEKVELSLDGTVWQLANGTSSWSGTLLLEGGENLVYARASDDAGNTATDVIHVWVGQGPIPPWVIPLAVAGAAGVAIVVGVILLRRRRRPG